MSRTPVSGDSSPPDELPLIRASELSQYSFCHRAWWLDTVKGVSPSSQIRLARGTRQHQRHARQVYAAGYWRQLGLILLGAGFLLLIGLVLWGLWG